MLRAVPVALASLLIAAAAPAVAAPTTGRLLVTLKPGHAGARAAVAALTARAPAHIAGPVVPHLGLVTVRPDHGVPRHDAAQALRRLPQVASVEVEHRAQLRALPNDPALTTPETAPGTPPGTVVEWWAQRENLPALWDITRGSGAVVAVIDTGVDATHPELASRIVGTVDYDGTAGDGPATVDEAGHGTHVASLACAVSDNNYGLAGAGRDCRLLIIKSDLSDSSVASSIVAAVDGGADAINMSFGTDGSQAAATPVVKAIDYAVAHGVVLVAAAADTPVQEQGDPSNVLQPTGTGADITQGKGLSVTAADFAGQRAPFAGYGSQISMAAYGAFATSTGPRGIFGAFPAGQTSLERSSLTDPGCACRTVFDGDSRFGYVQGTSMAAPMVTAVAAVLHHLNPDLSTAQQLRILKQTASRPAGSGWTADLGWGILNGGLAAAVVRVTDARPPRSAVKATHTIVRGATATLRITSADRAPAGCVASGVRKVELWRSTNGGRARRVLTTAKATVTVRVRRGSRYRFYTRAIDRAGNREAVPARPDTTVRAPKAASR